ncbi:MAG: ATP-binding protein [Eubacteriales bacterium]|nr:ATP-binding protein [Eubacteriales bacterium]
MTRRILNSILLVAAIVLFAGFVSFFAVLTDYFFNYSESQLSTQTKLVAQAVENEGMSYFDNLDANEARITLIAADGTVLFDTQSDASTMENHSEREEFIEAVKTGSGSASRNSSTLTERMLYHAQKLSDGSVLRLATSQASVLSLVMGMTYPVVIILIIALVLSAILASRLAKHIVKPLNELDLDKPLENDAYEELSPLLGRVERQHRQIESQLRQLRRRKEEWDAVVGNMNEGIVLLGSNNTILGVNRSAAKILDAHEDCNGNDFITICRNVNVLGLLERAARGEKAECIECFKTREYQISASTVQGVSGAQGVVLMFFDVTDRMNAEQMRREFTANVSHELKTPLHTISGSAEILKNGIVEPEDMPRFIDRIFTESQRMITLVDDIIGLSKLDEGEGDAPHTDLCLGDIALDVAERLKQGADAKHVSVNVLGDEGQMLGIRPLIFELVFNLCDNAIKYNRDGGTVDITITDSKESTAITVADTGIGIPLESQKRVFERFYRVDKSHSKEIGGTGLGLSIVKHVARLHDATISLSSTLGVGTSITIDFPKG